MSSSRRSHDGRFTPSHSAISMPRELSQTPAISRIGSTVCAPHIQACRLINSSEDYSHPLEHMTVHFEEDNLTLETTGLLGKGGFGKVFAAHSNSGESYALKVSSKRMSDNDWKRLNEEITLMSHFSKHPNIVRFVGAGKDGDRAYVIMERCASRSLHDVIANSTLELPEILWIGWSLVTTIAYLHSKGCIHRDLKPQNLLFDGEGNLKVTDFGLSSRISESQPRKTIAGTAMYMAPEMAEEVFNRMTKSGSNPSLSYGQEVDTWSIGVVLYVLLTRMNPYVDAIERKGIKQLDKEQKTIALFESVAGARWCWPSGWNEDTQLCRLITHILDPVRSNRATLQEVLEEPLWDRRPLSCPLTLRQKLHLFEPSPGGQYSPLDYIPQNIATYPNRTVSAVIREALARVEATEQRGRAQLYLEYHEAFNILAQAIALSRAEADARVAIMQEQEVLRGRLRNHMWARRGKAARGGSISLVSANVTPESGTPQKPHHSQRPSTRGATRDDDADDDTSAHGQIVRASPDQYAVVYPGRQTATRWSLRPVVSLPREFTSDIEQEFKCMNQHTMTKLTSMPHGYNGFDCNVCDRGILSITGERPAFRCYKCDYDICVSCAHSGRFKDVSFVCVTCAKRFTTSAKLQAHSLMCRGPSVSPSLQRSSRMDTMLWEEPRRPSLLEVQLPGEHSRESAGCRSSRPTYARTSTGSPITVGNTHVAEPEDVRALVVKRGDASFPEISKVSRNSGQKRSRRSASNSSRSDSMSFDLPPRVHLPQRDAGSKAKVLPRSSAELRDLILEVEEQHRRDPPAKRHQLDPDSGDGAAALHYPPAEVLEYNEQGSIIGIAARRRAESVEMSHGNPGAGVVTIQAKVADKPLEMPRQARVPRSTSATRAQNQRGNTGTPGGGRVLQKPQPPQPQLPPNVGQPVQASAYQSYPPLPQLPLKRAGSVSGMTAQGGPPLPRKGPAAPPSSSSNPRGPMAFQTPAAIPPQSFQTIRQSRFSMPNPMPAGSDAKGVTPARGHAPLPQSLAHSSGAFLALPHEEQNRQQFLDDFLSGGWVRLYSFTNEDTVVLYYCLQPGRYGAMFPTEVGVGTAVLDIYSKLVLYVPCMNNESTNRSQPHPHVQTFYDEDARILSISEAQRYLGGVLQCITGFVEETSRLKAEGLTPAAVHAAYCHHRNMSAVPRDTKFVYVRKVFPDPSGAFTLFRLSNLRSQVICNAMVDIRWQSDRRHNVGQKYYVKSDGTAEPFVLDQTGILSQVETVLNNSFRR